MLVVEMRVLKFRPANGSGSDVPPSPLAEIQLWLLPYRPSFRFTARWKSIPREGPRSLLVKGVVPCVAKALFAGGASVVAKWPSFPSQAISYPSAGVIPSGAGG